MREREYDGNTAVLSLWFVWLALALAVLRGTCLVVCHRALFCEDVTCALQPGTWVCGFGGSTVTGVERKEGLPPVLPLGPKEPTRSRALFAHAVKRGLRLGSLGRLLADGPLAVTQVCGVHA